MMMLRIVSLGILLLPSLLTGSNLRAGDVPPQPALGSFDAAPERTQSAGSPSGKDPESAPLEAAGAGRVLEMNYAAGRLSVKAERADLAILLRKISEVAGIEVQISSDISGTVSVSFTLPGGPSVGSPDCPTTNADGSQLTDLAGDRIHYLANI